MTRTLVNQSNVPILLTKSWQVAGEEFANRSQACLWSKIGEPARKYLHSFGLNDEILRKYLIGYNIQDSFGSLGDWGLPISYNSNGNLSKVWLPGGIVVPCYLENEIRSVKIRRYLTLEQKSKGEQQDYVLRGSASSLFGAENLRGFQKAIFTDNEFDAMLLEQDAGDIVGAVSFGKPTKTVGLSDWAMWRHYLLPIAYILVPFTHEDEKIIIIDSLPVFSRRTYRAYLPDTPSVQVVTDLRKVGMNPREWLIQTLHTLGLLESSEDENLGVFLPKTNFDKEGSVKSVNSHISNLGDDADARGIITPVTIIRTIDLNEPRWGDSTIMPKAPCYFCRYDEYWQRPDGGWVCSTCHPNPTIQ